MAHSDEERRRRLGKTVAHQADARRSLSALAAQRGTSVRAKQPSLEDITEDITEEISSVIREELAKRPSDAAALSFAGPLGLHVSAKGRVVWLVAIIVAVLVVGVVLGRVTVPREVPVERN